MSTSVEQNDNNNNNNNNNNNDKSTPPTTTCIPQTIVEEGSAKMTYPADQESTVFYNPVQVQNRDLSILMIALYGERRRKRQMEQQMRKQKLRAAEAKRQKDDNASNAVADTESTRKEEEQQPKMNVQLDFGLSILDALAASGLRSIRYWKELPGIIKHITINDLDPAAVDRARDNVRVNALQDCLVQDRDQHGIRIQCGDATHEMYVSRRVPGSCLQSSPLQQQQQQQQYDQYDVIDLDPYGSACIFLDGAVQAVVSGGLLCITCTDMAALGGSHPETAYGRYASMPIARAKHLQETALRILLCSVASAAARYGRTIRPVLSVGMAFYVRVFVEVNKDKAGVNDLSTKIGSIYQSTQCSSFYTVPHGHKKGNVYQPSRAPPVPQCQETGAPFKVAGPVWLGPLHDRDVVQAALERLEATNEEQRQESPPALMDTSLLATRERLRGLLTSVLDELNDVPLYYTLPDLSHTLRCSTPPLVQFKAALVNAGYRVSGYHKEPQAIKTDAPNRVVWDIMRVWCQKHPPKTRSKKKKEKQESTSLEQEDVAQRILKVEPVTTVDFSLPEGFAEKRTKVSRFPMNPEKNWGPKPRASGQKRKARDEAKDG